MRKTLPEKWAEGSLTKEDVERWFKENRGMFPVDIQDEEHLVHCLYKIYLHLEKDELVGDFLQAIVSNDLLEAGLRADNTNAKGLRIYAYFLHNVAPAPVRNRIRTGGD